MATHKYWCLYCRKYLYDNGITMLAATVNRHIDKFHPADYAGWTSTSIVTSAQYTRDDSSESVPAYLEPTQAIVHQRGDLDAKITAEDREFLAKGRVKW